MKVKVRNSFGKESDVYSLNFTVKPPWYRHYLAYLSYLLLLALIIYFVSVMVKMRYRKREYYKTIEQRKIYLEKESKIRKEQYLLEKEESREIASYDDNSKSNIDYTLKFRRTDLERLSSSDRLKRFLKIEERQSENLTVLDENGKLKIFNNAKELLELN